MWPFGSSPSSSVDTKEDEITEAQLRKLFSEASSPAPANKAGTDTPGLASSGPSQVSPEVSTKEDPCSLQYYFDEFFMCYTPKSQLRNWYRYGEKKDCGERWKDLKWCMRTRMTDEESAQEKLKERKIVMQDKVHSGPNSEDVWQIREHNLERPWQQGQNADLDPVSIS